MSPFRLFVDRPVLASVMSILIVIVGVVSYFALPVSQYPDIAPPTVTVSASYPGADATTVADTVASPIEQEINGVDGMIYMSSQSTGDGNVTVTVSFEQGTDIDQAQVLVQNRVALAEPRLPEPVRRLGVVTRKSSPNILMIVNVFSKDNSRQPVYLSNYIKANIVDKVARIDGVGQARVFAERAYSMRIWLDPARVAARGMMASDVVSALRNNNVQVAAGVLNRQPIEPADAYEISVQTQGRLTSVEDFEQLVIRQSDEGRFTRLSDVARVELSALDYSISGYQGISPSIPLAIFQSPGTNALETAAAIQTMMDSAAADFPAGVDYDIVYNPTDFIATSIDEVYITIVEAILLVMIVVVIFLQSWRAAIIPILAIPVSLIGTFILMLLLGFSLNTLTLFGLVLAVGIVVDDAIVVVENVERNLRLGLPPTEAARKTMDEVGGAVIAIGLVLAAVFVPVAFVEGISGAFYKQFALTIAAATLISVLVSITLSPALSGILLRESPSGDNEQRRGITQQSADAFNQGFNRLSRRYADLTRRLIRFSPVVFFVYTALLALTVVAFMRTPVGFIPSQDQGFMIAVVQLPAGSSISRTQRVVENASAMMLEHPAVKNSVGFAGFDGATFTGTPSGGAIFVTLKPFDERLSAGNSVGKVLGDLQRQVGQIKEANVFLVEPPPVRGIGNAGGWKLYVQDITARGAESLEQVVNEFIDAANQDPSLSSVFSVFNTATPQIFADIDRDRAEMLGVLPQHINDALEVNLGSAFVNDFNFLGQTYRVTAQAEGEDRRDISDIANYKVRSSSGAMVPLGSVTDFEERTGPYRLPRYNLYTAVDVQGSPAAGVSTGAALTAVEALADQVLPNGYNFEWTDLSFQQSQAGNTGPIVFALAVLFVYLVLAALYESLMLPLAVIMIVPLCLLAALAGINLRGMDNNILTQIGLIVLIGLACKNAILIVEFARQAHLEGKSRAEAAVEAARVRLRPILMTSFAFVFGVIPLMIASGAGAELRQALGTAVFAGMLGVTLFGLLFTPVFYVACQGISDRWASRHSNANHTPSSLDAQSLEHLHEQ